jgi:hypothetical protein
MTSPKFVNPNHIGGTVPAKNVRKFSVFGNELLDDYNKALLFRNTANANIKQSVK